MLRYYVGLFGLIDANCFIKIERDIPPTLFVAVWTLFKSWSWKNQKMFCSWRFPKENNMYYWNAFLLYYCVKNILILIDKFAILKL